MNVNITTNMPRFIAAKNHHIFRKSGAAVRMRSVKKVFLNISQKFFGKHLCRSLFQIKLKVPATLLTDFGTDAFPWIFKNTFFYRTPPAASSGKFTDREISESKVKGGKTENSDRKKTFKFLISIKKQKKIKVSKKLI